MKIWICDDKENELKQIMDIADEYATAHSDLLIEIKGFLNPFDLMEDIQKFGAADIMLLDIYMPGILGTEIAREILSKNENGTDIIFLTVSSDFAVEAFSLHASDYLSKPYTKERLMGALDRVIDKRKRHMYVPIQCGKEIYRIDLSNVLYAETKNHMVQIHLKSGQCLETRTTLVKLMDLFTKDDSFVSVGASYMVNFIYVQRLFGTMLEMINGDKIPIPRRLRSELKKQYFEFYTAKTEEDI